MGFLDIFRKKQSFEGSGILKGMEDRHSHILFGVDDGIASLDDSLKVLSYVESRGITDVWCTPHIMEDVPNTSDFLRQRFTELQQAYQGNVRLHLAAEYMLDNLFEQRLCEKDLLTMEDDSVLVETSTWNPPPQMWEMLSTLKKAGYHPILAHPERYRYLKDEDYEKIYKDGIQFQLNLASLTGYYGGTAMHKARMLLKKGWYRHYGSDCHKLPVLQEQYRRETLDKEILDRL